MVWDGNPETFDISDAYTVPCIEDIMPLDLQADIQESSWYILEFSPDKKSNILSVSQKLKELRNWHLAIPLSLEKSITLQVQVQTLNTMT
jgi:hypothetical protein